MKQKQFLTAAEFLAHSEPGTSVWDWTTVFSPSLIPVARQSGLSTEIPQFMAKVATCDLPYLEHSVAPIAIASGGIQFLKPDLLLIFVVWAFSRSPEYIYETWINHYGYTQKSPLHVLQQSQQLHFAFFDHSSSIQARRIYKVNNKISWKSCLSVAESISPWSDEAFDRAKDLCPYTARELWSMEDSA